MKKLTCILCVLLPVLSPLSAEIAWKGTPYRISTLGVDASEPQIGIDHSGNGVAIWLENGLVRASTYPVSGVWSVPQTLSLSGAETPQIAVDINGNATAIWNESGIIKSATLPYGGTWSSASHLSNSGAADPQIAVDSFGNVTALWTRNGYLESSTRLFGDDWPLEPVVISDKIADFAQIAIGSNGEVVAIWHGVESSVDTVYVNTKSLSGGWKGPHTISNAHQNSVFPQIAVDPFGNALAAWFRYDNNGYVYSNVILQAAYFDGKWNAPVDVSSPGIYNPADLTARVVLDGNGNGAAAWNNSFDGATFVYQASVLSKGGHWSQPLNILLNNIYADSIDLAVDAEGHAQLIYMGYDPTGYMFWIETNELDLFGNPVHLNSASILSWPIVNGYPVVATSTDGSNIHAIGLWIFYNGSDNVIHSSIGTGKVYAPPSGLTVRQMSQEYPILTEYYNVLSWTASSNNRTIGYQVYRDGQLIQQVPATTLRIVDHNQPQFGSVIYGVSAYDSKGNQSSIVTVSLP